MAQVSGPQWAADPYGRYELRFWDGSMWTEHVSRHGVQARDPLAPVAPVVPQVPFEQEPFGQEPFAELLPRSSRAGGVPGHTRQGAGAAKAPRRKGLTVLLAAGAASAVVVVVASLGGQPSTPTASSTTDSIQPLAAVPSQSSTRTTAATPAAKATSRTTTKAAAKKTSPTTTKATTSTTSKKPRTTTTTRPKASTTKPRSTTSTRARTTTSTKPAAKDYANCTAMHADYPHGVGKPGAVDRTSGTPPVTDFVRNNALYAANAESDRDGDDIACESH